MVYNRGKKIMKCFYLKNYTGTDAREQARLDAKEWRESQMNDGVKNE